MRLPRMTTRWLMIAVACLGVGLTFARWTSHLIGNTNYSPGYDEGRFSGLRSGMSLGEVESIMGPPLSKHTYDDPGNGHFEDWAYTCQIDATRDYWRRHVLFLNGKVCQVINEFWDD